MIRSLIIILVLLFINNCGFKPIHRITETDSNFSNYTVEVQNSVSREIIDELNASFTADGEINYKAVISVNEDLNPLIINTNGTVAKYRIEIEINYQLIELDSGDVISEGTTRGFAQYDTVDSEVSNEDTRKSMTKIAAKNALQIMSSRIQSSILK
tara:strand:- start:144 stop:611 length:468 start_codon:yes stop_codon:yes gene_type:complete